jgi:hypothetical protein
VGFLESAQKVFLAPCRLDAYGTCSIYECHEVYSFVEIVRSIKGFYVMSAHELIKFDDGGGRAVKDRTSAKPVDQESPFHCHLCASNDVENYMYFRSVFAIWKMELAGNLYLCLSSS